MEMTQDEEQEITTEKEEGDFCDQLEKHIRKLCNSKFVLRCLLEYSNIVTEKFLNSDEDWMDGQRSFVFSEITTMAPPPHPTQFAFR